MPKPSRLRLTKVPFHTEPSQSTVTVAFWKSKVFASAFPQTGYGKVTDLWVDSPLGAEGNKDGTENTKPCFICTERRFPVELKINYGSPGPFSVHEINAIHNCTVAAAAFVLSLRK